MVQLVPYRRRGHLSPGGLFNPLVINPEHLSPPIAPPLLPTSPSTTCALRDDKEEEVAERMCRRRPGSPGPLPLPSVTP